MRDIMELNKIFFNTNSKFKIGIATGVVQNFLIEKQIMSNWCWAAATVSICRHYGNATFNQKQIVASITGKQICATSPPIGYCNDKADLGIALNRAGRLENSFTSALPAAEVVKYNTNNRPIVCQLYLPALGGGHAVIIYGSFTDLAGNLMLEVADPADGNLLITPYNQFINN